MKTRSALVLALLLAAGPALAQSAPAPAAAPAATAPAAATPAASAPAPTLTKDGKPRMKDVRAQCKTEADGGALKGDARRTAMADCMMKARPDKAAAIQCRMDPSLKGLDKTARKTAVQACIAKAKG